MIKSHRVYKVRAGKRGKWWRRSVVIREEVHFVKCLVVVVVN